MRAWVNSRVLQILLIRLGNCSSTKSNPACCDLAALLAPKMLHAFTSRWPVHVVSLSAWLGVGGHPKLLCSLLLGASGWLQGGAIVRGATAPAAQITMVLQS